MYFPSKQFSLTSDDSTTRERTGTQQSAEGAPGIQPTFQSLCFSKMRAGCWESPCQAQKPVFTPDSLSFDFQRISRHKFIMSPVFLLSVQSLSHTPSLGRTAKRPVTAVHFFPDFDPSYSPDSANLIPFQAARNGENILRFMRHITHPSVFLLAKDNKQD